jgi:hypothetical protein
MEGKQCRSAREADEQEAAEKESAESKWQERVVCKECGHHWADSEVVWSYNEATLLNGQFISGAKVRRMRKVNGEWETHILDDPELRDTIYSLALEVLDLHEAKYKHKPK